MTGTVRGTVLYAGPAVAWILHLVVSYLLIPPACDSTTVPLHVTTALLLAAAVVSLLIGLRAHASARAAPLGVTLGGLFVAAILLQGAANLVVDPCA